MHNGYLYEIHNQPAGEYRSFISLTTDDLDNFFEKLSVAQDKRNSEICEEINSDRERKWQYHESQKLYKKTQKEGDYSLVWLEKY